MSKNEGCFMTAAELEYLREKFSDNQDLSRVFKHIDALESLIQEKTEAYEEMMDENADEWSDVGSYIVDSEYNREELISQVEALQDRAIDLERMRDLNKADAVSLATDVVRLMRKVPYVAR